MSQKREDVIKSMQLAEDLKRKTVLERYNQKLAKAEKWREKKRI